MHKQVILMMVVVLLCSSVHAGGEQSIYSWVTLTGQGQAIARVAIEGGRCPDIEVDGVNEPMALRSQSGAPSGFQNIDVCEYAISSTTSSLSVDGEPLPIPSSQPQKIAIIGDTGCRMKGSTFQNCNNVAGLDNPWLFEQLAKKLAAMQPDLIIHVGDYHYRETPCPEGNAGCAGSPYGDNWDSWKIDFFEPAQALLPQAPWIFTRGNHEDCERAWRGWFYFLDAAPLTSKTFDQCAEYTVPYVVPFSDFQVAVLDSTTVPHSFSPPPNPATVDKYRVDFNQINQWAKQGNVTWLMTHRPLWGVSSYTDNRGATQISAVDFTLQTALAASEEKVLDNNVKLLLAGHVHKYEFINFDDGRPPQMVAGASGTKLGPAITPDIIAANQSVFDELNLKPENFHAYDEISFAILTPVDGGWQVTVHGLAGELGSYFVRR